MTAGGDGRKREAGRSSWMDDLLQDVRYGARSLLRTRGFTLLAVITLALGIGANAAVFGVVKSVLLDALPYADADRIVRIQTHNLDGTYERGPVSAAIIQDVRERQRSFASMAGFNSTATEAVFEGGDGTPQVGQLAWVEPALFRTLGVQAAVGRTFLDEDIADTARVVVVEHRAWQRLFGGNEGVLGSTARINGIPRTIIGILPRDFVGPIGEADFYFPFSLAGPNADPVRARLLHWYGMVGRVRPGVSIETAQREVASIGAELAAEHPDFHGGRGMSAVPIREAMVGDTRTPLLVLLASAALVLIITCANLAGALLSRTLSRRKEFAVRIAIGAGRGRLVRQLLTESSMVALAGGLGGILLARGGLSALRRLAPPALPDYAELALDPGAVLVTGIIALLTGVAFGLAPALAAGRDDVHETLRSEGRGASESRRTRHLRGVLVAGQIALCVSLLAGAGLLTRSLVATLSTPLGLRQEGVLAFAVQLPRGSYPTPEARVRFIEEFSARLRALPGVTSVGAAGQVPTTPTGRNQLVREGSTEPAGGDRPLLLSEASDDYFRTLGIPVLEGRTFRPEDGTVEALNIVLNRSAARAFFPEGGAVGSTLKLGREPGVPSATVIGVVGDVRNDPALPEAEPAMYMTIRQAPWNGPVFLLRTQGDPLAHVAAARRTLADLDPSLPLFDPRPLQAVVDEGLTSRRLPVLLMGAFGALALLLASVGVYAMFAAMAAAREKEFGVRVALGSTRRDIAMLVLRQGGVWMGVGLAIGAGGVIIVARLVRGLLYGAPSLDPVALAGALGILLVCAALALLVPVRRAMRVDPISVLR